MTERGVQLDDWLSAQPSEAFPMHGKVDYFKRFSVVSEYLNNEVHPHVEKGALVRQDGFLTDHGPEHIRTVIMRLSELIGDPAGQFTPYEVYLLLMAAHFHDVGNIFGRKGHEEKLAPVMAAIGELMGGNAVERRAIQQIARAHGGQVNGDKDTIAHLLAADAVLGDMVHMQQLAALLRFADELADDYTRASRFLLKLGEIPKESEVFHRYAAHLHSVVIDKAASSVSLYFSFNKAEAVASFGKLADEVFLLDEIFERSLKMNLERVYCNRFMSKVVRIDSINVNIEVFLSDHTPLPLHKIGYRLEERGYPEPPAADIRSICPGLQWTGESLREALLDRVGSEQGDLG